MPLNPTPSTALTRPDLAAVFDEFDLEASHLGFIGLKALPVFESNKQSGSFKRRKIASLLKEYETKRASGANYNRGAWDFTEDSFATFDNGFEETVDDREAAIYADYFDAEADSARQARDVVLRGYEKRVCDKLLDAAVFTGALTNAVTTAWSTPATAVPITDIRTAKIAIRNRTGIIANALILEWEAYQFLLDNVQILDRAKSSGFFDPQKGRMNAQIIALSLDLDELIISGGQRNTANEAAAAALSPIWDRTQAMLTRVGTPGATLSQVCVGRTIHWGEDGSEIGGRYETYREEGARGQVVRNRFEETEKLLYPQLGQRLTGVLA